MGWKPYNPAFPGHLAHSLGGAMLGCCEGAEPWRRQVLRAPRHGHPHSWEAGVNQL